MIRMPYCVGVGVGVEEDREKGESDRLNVEETKVGHHPAPVCPIATSLSPLPTC